MRSAALPVKCASPGTQPGLMVPASSVAVRWKAFTTSDAIASWNPYFVTSQPPALQPQAASMIQTAEPSRQVRSRYAESLTRSISAPDMIEPVVQEKSRNARKKTPLMWSPRFGPS